MSVKTAPPDVAHFENMVDAVERPDDPRPVTDEAVRARKQAIRQGRLRSVSRDECPPTAAEQAALDAEAEEKAKTEADAIKAKIDADRARHPDRAKLAADAQAAAKVEAEAEEARAAFMEELLEVGGEVDQPDGTKGPRRRSRADVAFIAQRQLGLTDEQWAELGADEQEQHVQAMVRQMTAANDKPDTAESADPATEMMG